MPGPTDQQTGVRDCVLDALRSYPALTRMIPKERIYPEETPATPDWPFIRYGFPIITPTEATGSTGDLERVTVHVFARGPGTDKTAAACRQVGLCLDQQELTFGDDQSEGYLAELFHVGTQIIRDTDEAASYHGIVEFDVMALTDLVRG